MKEQLRVAVQVGPGMPPVTGPRVVPFLPNRAAMIHLVRTTKPRYGTEVTALCGRSWTVGIGSAEVSVRTYRDAHDSMRCSQCKHVLEGKAQR